MLGNYNILAALFLCFSITPFAMAQIANPITTAYGSGTFETDRFSQHRPVFYLNPAILPFQEYMIFSGHVENRFTGFDLSAISLLISHSFHHGIGAGVSFYHFGLSDYHHSGFQGNIGKRIGKNFSIGISEKIGRIKVLDEGRPWQGHTLISVLYKTAGRGLMVSADGLIPFGKIQQENKSHPQLKLEIAGFQKLQPSTMIFMLIKYEADKFYPVAAIKQHILGEAELYASFQVFPARYGIGFTIPLVRTLLCMVSTQYHPVLGWSPNLGLQKSLKPKN